MVILRGWEGIRLGIWVELGGYSGFFYLLR